MGSSIADLILNRCQLEDAFLMSTLLETKLEILRDRGFPVDRIIKPSLPPEIESKSNILQSEPVAASEDDKTKVDGEADHELESNCTESSINNDKVRNETSATNGDHLSTLKQIFPGVDESYLREKLGGDDTNLDQVQNIAEEMAMKGYPTTDESTQKVTTPKKEEQKSSKLLGSRKLGKAFDGLKSSNFGGKSNPSKLNGDQSDETVSVQSTQKNDFTTPGDDAKLQASMEEMLQKRIQNAARTVDLKGFQSPEVSIKIPEGLGHGSSCEVVPSQDLIPSGESHNGLKIFSYRKDPQSKSYLQINHDAVECFAVVLERLCMVFELPTT